MSFGSAINRPAELKVDERLVGTLTAALLVIASLLVGLIVFEFSCYMFVPSIGRASANQRQFDWWNHRITFFDGAGSIFQNHGDIFTYVPHNDIRNQLEYFSDTNFSIEYDYRFHTNNYGLVQDSDIVGGRPSILLLGDSFTGAKTPHRGFDNWRRKPTNCPTRSSTADCWAPASNNGASSNTT